MLKYEDTIKIYDVARTLEYRKWTGEIPVIHFPSDWGIRVIPPFGGAVVRFKVVKENATVSVYLDCYDQLGVYGKPYWEVYPFGEDITRCDMEDTKTLLENIAISIEQQLNPTQQ